MDGQGIRPATPADLEIVLRHRRRMFEDMGVREEAAMAAMLACAAPDLRRRLEDGSYRGWLVEDAAGAVIAGGGVVVLEVLPSPVEPRTRRAWVVNLFTEPEHRHRGCARLLMETMIAWCRAEGFPRLFLHASDEGRPLYERLGFTPTSEMRLSL